MLQKNPNGLQVVDQAGKLKLQLFGADASVDGPELHGESVRLSVQVNGDRVAYSYSLDEGRSFHQLGDDLPITFSFWKGSRPALFAYRDLAMEKADSHRATEPDHDAWVDFDWAHYRYLSPSELSMGR